jgi:hypothetical protein
MIKNKRCCFRTMSSETFQGPRVSEVVTGGSALLTLLRKLNLQESANWGGRCELEP